MPPKSNKIANKSPMPGDPPARNQDNRVKTSGVRITASIRRIEAMKLRQAGYAYKEIGDHLGCSTQRAHQLVSEEFARLRAEQNDLAENILKLTADRIERLIKVHWLAALQGDRTANEIVLKLIDRQARLFGVDAPKKTENKLDVVVSDDPERLKALARMRGLDVSDLLADNDDSDPDGSVKGGEHPAFGGESSP